MSMPAVVPWKRVVTFDSRTVARIEAFPQAERGARAHVRRQPPDVPTAKRRQVLERPIGGVASGTGDDLLVGRRFFPMEEAENRPQRRETDAAIAHSGGAQPVLVKLEPDRRNVGNTLMQARDEQSADSGVNHDEGVRI